MPTNYKSWYSHQVNSGILPDESGRYHYVLDENELADEVALDFDLKGTQQFCCITK